MTERHFRVVQLDGKKVEIGGVSISAKASPWSAARKLLTSIAHHKGLKKNKKASMPKVKFCIEEYTQGSSKKVYGPYVGHYHKYTAAELKKAMTADGKVKFTMKPVVKLVKGKNMKGGLFGNEIYLVLDVSFTDIYNYKLKIKCINGCIYSHEYTLIYDISSYVSNIKNIKKGDLIQRIKPSENTFGNYYYIKPENQNELKIKYKNKISLINKIN